MNKPFLAELSELIGTEVTKATVYDVIKAQIQDTSELTLAREKIKGYELSGIVLSSQDITEERAELLEEGFDTLIENAQLPSETVNHLKLALMGSKGKRNTICLSQGGNRSVSVAKEVLNILKTLDKASLGQKTLSQSKVLDDKGRSGTTQVDPDAFRIMSGQIGASKEQIEKQLSKMGVK